MKFIGYSKLEDLLAGVSSSEPLYLILIEETIPGSDGIDLFHSELLLQASSKNESSDEVRYWRLFIGEALAPGGKPWPEQAEKIRARGKSALDAIKQFLSSEIKVERIEEGAFISMPRDLKLLRGFADCLEFDKPSSVFRLKKTS